MISTWEQRKLEDIYGSIGNAFVGTATPYYVESGHFYLESNNIKDGQINHNTEVFINDEFYEKQKDKWLHTGDMVMVQSGHVGHAAVIPEELNNSAAHALIMFRNPKKEIEPYFLNYQYQTLKSKKKIENITTGNTIKHILASEMQQFEVDMPELAEQKKIAEYFRALDHLITLHQRKLEHVKKMKKSMLQKMFPKKNQLYPEVRFPGFTDAWEQRKLEDIYGSIGNAFVGTATPYYVESGHFYLESNNIKDGQINHNTEVFINDEFYEKQKDKWLHTGDMVMVQSGHVGHAAVIPEELNNSAAHALIMFRNPKKEIEPYFLNYQYQTLKSKKKIENITTGNTIKHILASEMQQFEVDMPELAEQKKIAEYFRALDHLITLHQRKLEHVKKMKKSMLQKMFPKKNQLYPEVRFPGFTDAWEQRKFSDIAARESSVSTSASDTPSVEYEDVVAEEGRLNKDIHLKEVVKSGITFDGSQVLYGKLRPYLHNWLNPDFKGIAVGDWWVLKPMNMDKNFLYRLIQTQQFDNIANQSSGSKMPRADWNLISNSEFMVPFSKEEQGKIGRYFDSLDHLITLHQRESIFAFILKNITHL